MFCFSPHPAKQHVVPHASREPLCIGKVFTWGSLWSHHKSKLLPLISLEVCAASLGCFLFLSRLMHKMVLWRQRWLIWRDLRSQHLSIVLVCGLSREKKENPGIYLNWIESFVFYWWFHFWLFHEQHCDVLPLVNYTFGIHVHLHPISFHVKICHQFFSLIFMEIFQLSPDVKLNWQL